MPLKGVATMKQVPTYAQPKFDLPDCTTGALDYLAQVHTDEMYAFVHLFHQESPLFGLPETYALNSFYLMRYPYGKTGRKQHEKGQYLLERFTKALTHAGWTLIGVSPNNHKTPIWQAPSMYNEDAYSLSEVSFIGHSSTAMVAVKVTRRNGSYYVHLRVTEERNNWKIVDFYAF
jgi:hypothetical protein